MYFIIFLMVGLALAAPLLHRWLRGATGWVLALFPLGLTVYFASLLGRTAAGDILHISQPWVAALDINLSFRMDGLGLLLALLVSGIGTLIIIYGGGYLEGDPQIGRFYMLILLFMGAMLGLVLADSLILLFVFWELTSITSYLLIGFKHDKEASRDSALQALLVTGGGGLAMLAGLVLLGLIGEGWAFSELMGSAVRIQQHPLYSVTLLLLLLGAFTKSAQFPFHFWLPNAMAAPTPVSAYLHSATMVKAGIYLLARLNPIMGNTGEWFYSLTIIGAITALVGAWLAWQNTDLKRILAYSTVSALGLLTMMLGIGTEYAVEAAAVFLLVHALYKGALFMSAGTIEHETGTRDITRLGDLARSMRITLVAVFLAAFAMAGFPPALAFIGKELLYEATLGTGLASGFLTAAAVITNALMVVVAGIVFIGPFFGPRVEPGAKGEEGMAVHEAPPAMWLGSLLLGGLSLLFGIFAAPLGRQLVAPVVESITGHSGTVSLALWHGVNTMLILSLLTFAGGILLYLGHRPLLGISRRLTGMVSNFGPAQWYEWGLAGMMRFATAVTSFFQNRHLRNYLITINLTVIGLVALFLVGRGIPVWPEMDLSNVEIHDWGIAAMIILAALYATQVESRLAAVAALGVVGYGIALIYSLFGAPDLAITQFSVETLIVILFVLVLYRLPHFERFTKKWVRVRDTVVALAVGLVMTTLVLAATAVETESRLTDFYAENSYVVAHGRNTVNVILVDFRGLDTMVEITVLAVAAIGVYALLKLRPEQEADSPAEE